MNENLKSDKLRREISRQAGIFILNSTNHTSLITATNIVISPNGKTGLVLISVIPEHKEKAALDFLKRQEREFTRFLKNNIKTAFVPHFKFEIDKGEKNRQRIEEISKKS